MFEYEPYEHKVRGYGDGEHGNRCHLATESDPEEEVEEHDMQQVVHQMRPTESDAVLRRGLLLKREVGREVVVHQEAQHVADGIGHVHLYPVLQYPVDGIVDGSRCRTHDAESDQFAQRLFLLHVALILSAKIHKKPHIGEYSVFLFLFLSDLLYFCRQNTTSHDQISNRLPLL